MCVPASQDIDIPYHQGNLCTSYVSTCCSLVCTVLMHEVYLISIHRIYRLLLAFLHAHNHTVQSQHQKPDGNRKSSAIPWRAKPAHSYNQQCTVKSTTC